MGLVALAAGPSSATLRLPSLDTSAVLVKTVNLAKTKTVCKSVLVLGKTTPTVDVTIGGKTHAVDVRAFAAADVRVCVEVGVGADLTAAVDVAITASVDASNVLCPVVTGNVHVGASVDGGGIFVRVSGLGHDGKALTVDTAKLHLLPAGTDADVPLLLVVCDP